MSYYTDDDAIALDLFIESASWDEYDYWLEVYRRLHYGFEVLARGEEP